MIETPTTDQINASRASTVRLAFFVELQLTSGTQYLCSAIRNIDWNGHTWGGLGALASISGIEEKTSLEAVSATVGLSGVPLSWRSLALQEPIRGRRANVWVGLFDENEQLIGNPTLEYSGLLDAPQIATSAPDENGERTAEISIRVGGILADFARRGRGRRHTDADQQAMYPGDTFYSRADHIATKLAGSIPWGVPRG